MFTFAQKVFFLFLFFFLARGAESNGKKRGICFEGSSSASDLPLFLHERWVWVKIPCWKGDLSGGWTEGGVCLRGTSISNCVALLSAMQFLLKSVRKYRLRRRNRSSENIMQSELWPLRDGNFLGQCLHIARTLEMVITNSQERTDANEA